MEESFENYSENSCSISAETLHTLAEVNQSTSMEIPHTPAEVCWQSCSRT